MKILRRWYWIVSGFTRKYALGLALGAIVGGVLISNLNTVIALIPMKKTTYIGRVGSMTLTQLPLDIQELISKGITKLEPDGQVSLDIALNMEVSDDGREYYFTLPQDLYWSNGDPFTTQDIDLTLKDVEIIKADTYQLTFKLKEPFAPLPAVVSQPLLKKVTTGRMIKRSHIIGLNSFAITDIVLHKQFINSLTLDSPQEKRIYQFYPTEDEALTAFKLGKVDALEMISNRLLDNWPHVKVQEVAHSNRYLGLFFNTTNQFLQDKSIRQLLAYATPKDTLHQRVISPISATSWVYNPQVKPYDYNPDTVTSSLQKLKETNPNLALDFTITTTPAYQKTAAYIATAWNSLGIQTNVKIVAFPDTNDYDILLIGQQIPPDPDQYALWHSTQSTNITKYKNPLLDKKLEDGRKERDPQKRKLVYQDFQRFLVEDCPAVFLEQLVSYNISRNSD
jgi:peptide/nickel transport system substrate-binding protein